MVNFKVLHILKILSPGEIKDFEKFLASPFFSTGRDLKKLFLYLKKYYPGFDDKKALSIDTIHRKVTIGKSKPDATRKLLSDLFKQAEKYLAVKNFLKDEHNYTISKLKELNRLETIGLFENSSGEYLKKLESKGMVEPEFYQRRADTLTEIHYLYLKKEDLKSYFPLFTQISDLRFLSSLVVLYRTRAAHYTFKKSFNFDPSNTISDSLPEIIDHKKVLELIRKFYPDDYPVLVIYYYVYISHYKPENLEYYYLLKENFFSNIERFSHNEAYNLFKYIEGYIILSSAPVFNKIQENADLSRKMLEHGIYSPLKHGEMYVITFLNLLTTLADNNETEYAENFLNNYINRVNKIFRENCLNFSTAYVLWKKNEFKQALRYLSRVVHDSLYISFKTYILNIILHYELNLHEELLYKIDSFQHYLKNNRSVSENKRKNNMNFIKAVRLLIVWKTKPLKQNNDYFINEINKLGSCSYKYWIDKKVKESQLTNK